MKYIILLLLSLLVVGCGKKSSSEGSDSAGESAEPSADTAKPPPADPHVAESPSEEPSSDTPNSLSDADVERLLKGAVDMESLEERDDLYYQPNESEPFSGWVKQVADSGYVRGLAQCKDGKPEGPFVGWHENGQKQSEGTFKNGGYDGPYTDWHENGQKQSEGRVKNGKEDGLWTEWHENGQKKSEGIYKDGEEVSAKYWNSKGEEVETEEEAFK